MSESKKRKLPPLPAHHPGVTRDYKGENERYNGKPQTIKNRDARNAARALEEKKLGRKLPTKMEVDHVKPLIKKGSNKAANLRVVTRFANRSKGDR